ncbi:hypothetical protein KY325_01110, partial [Candidatus Woesearchaeota archaeon]|nr:hypothetical protein [Candidatus Woesearchaeota archaeon]
MKKRTFIIVSLLFVVLLALTSCVPGGEPYRGEDGLFGGGDSFSKSISPETREGMEGLELAANILLGFITSKSVSFVVLFVLFWILLYGIFNTALSKALKVDKLTKMHKMISFSLGGVIMFSLFFVVKNPFARMVSIAGSMNMLFAIFISIIVFLCMKYMWNREGDQEGGRGNFSSLLAAFVALMLFSGLARGVTGISGLAATMQIIVGVILVLVVAGGLLGHIGERVAPGSRLGGPTSDRTWLGDPRGPAAGREPGEGISPRHAAALREFDQRMNDLSRQIDQVIRDVGAERAHIRQLRELHERKEDMVERIHQLYGGRVRAAIQSQQLMQGSGRGGSRLNPRNWFRRRGLPDLIDAQQEIINQLDEFIRDLGAHLEDLHRMFGLTHINFARIEGELRRVVEGLTHPSTQFRLRSGQRLNFEQILRRLADLLNDEREFLTTRVEWTIPNDYVDIHNYQEQEELIAVLEQVFGREMRDAFAVVVKAVEMERIAGTITGLLTQGYTELAAGNMPQARTACDNA